MKILRVIASMDPVSGGPCQGIRNTIQAMQDLNISNEVVCTDPSNATFLKSDPFKIFPMGTGKNPWAYSKLLLPWLLKNIPRYDAVIVHGLWLYPDFAVMRAMHKLKEKDRRPWYVMPHGMLDPYFQNAPDRKLKAVRNSIYWQIIERKIINNADGILFTSAEELVLAKNTFPDYRPKQAINVGYGIQPPPSLTEKMKFEFQKASGLKPDQKYFLFLSRIHPKKGVDLLIEAYAACMGSIHSADQIPILVIAGPGLDTDFGKSILTEVNNNEQLAGQVLFPGMLSGPSKWGALYGAEAFVLPSHQENFGIAVVEALACKTPVLISNKINIWREIDTEQAGIVETDTKDGAKKMISKWITLPIAEKGDMRIKALQAFQKNFEINTNIKALLRVLSGTFVKDEL